MVVVLREVREDGAVGGQAEDSDGHVTAPLGRGHGADAALRHHGAGCGAARGNADSPDRREPAVRSLGSACSPALRGPCPPVALAAALALPRLGPGERRCDGGGRAGPGRPRASATPTSRSTATAASTSLHYDVHDRYRFGDRRLSGQDRRSRCAPPQDLSRFDLDFLLPVTAVRSTAAGARSTAATATSCGSRRARRSPPASSSPSRSPTPARPATRRYARGAQLAGRRPRGRRDERAAHGAVVVPRQRPPARQGHDGHHGSPCPSGRR